MRVRGVGFLLAVSMLALAASSPHGAAQLGVTESGVVRGRVEIGIPVTVRRPSTVYPSRAVGQPVLAPASELRHVVVFIKDAPATRTAPTNVEIRQRDENFIPRVVAVPVGSTVDFPNDDPIYHNVFSLSRAKSFNLGRYPRGDTRRVHVSRPGVVKVFCDIHSHMTATIMVFNHPWFAVIGEDGRFELNGIPAGDRQITAWHERLGDTTVRLRVDAGGVTEANFVLPVPPQ